MIPSNLLWPKILLAWLLSALLLACGGDQATPPPTKSADTPVKLGAQPVPAIKQGSILFFGDSLSAGYQMSPDQAWPILLRARANKLGFDVINASVSGETTAGGLARLARLLETYRPNVLVIALGANDGLRGLPTSEMHGNLTAMIKLAKANQVRRFLLIGIQLPPNFGPDYNQEFEAVFANVAAEQHIAQLPFLLQPIASNEAMFNDDRLHPIPGAQPLIADHVWSTLQPVLQSNAAMAQ